MTQNSDHPGDYCSNSQADLGRLPDFGQIYSWVPGNLTWGGWVNHSWGFGHAEALLNWVPKCLNADQKLQRCQSSEQILVFLGAIQMISCRDWWSWRKTGYITMTRRQSNNQCSGDITFHPAPKKFEYKNPLKNISPQFFWDQGGILLVDYLPKGQTIGNWKFVIFLPARR